MKKYLYISNGSKNEDYLSKEEITLNNMRKCCIIPAIELGYQPYMSQNRKYVKEIRVKDYDIEMYDANIYRSVFNIKDNLIAYRNLNAFLKENKIDVIHCNSPIGGLLGRICGSKNHVDVIIYTAHGFHFYKGNNPIKNFIFRTIEKHLAKKTDVIITINQEDYEAAKRFKLKNGGKVFLTHGVGIDLEDFKKIKVDKEKKRKELGLSKNDIVIISTGDLVKRKNYRLALNIIAKCNNKRIKYLVCGKGPELKKLKKQARQLGIEGQVLFLGHRTDVKELLKISDIFLFTTRQEGLPRSLMEAMASSLPCVVSDVRGNNDLTSNYSGAICCSDICDYKKAIDNIIRNKERYNNICDESHYMIMRKYSFNTVKTEMINIYKTINAKQEQN